MAENRKDVWPPGELFRRNQNQFPAEELAKYAGQHVAWSRDGTRILASGPDDQAVEDALKAAGVDPSTVVFSYVDPPDLVRL
jgi:hypothetical protein